MAGIDHLGDGAVSRRCRTPLKPVRVSAVSLCRTHRAEESSVKTPAVLPFAPPPARGLDRVLLGVAVATGRLAARFIS